MVFQIFSAKMSKTCLCPFSPFVYFWKAICLAQTKNVCASYLFKENRHLCSILRQLPNMSIVWHMKSRLWRHTMPHWRGSCGANASVGGLAKHGSRYIECQNAVSIRKCKQTKRITLTAVVSIGWLTKTEENEENISSVAETITKCFVKDTRAYIKR